MLPDIHPFRIFIMIVPASLFVNDCYSSPSPVETTHRSECFTASLGDLETSSRSTQMMVPFPTSETALRIRPGLHRPILAPSIMFTMSSLMFRPQPVFQILAVLPAPLLIEFIGASAM